jgi:molecular chaperone DnaK (HSP70)
MGACELAVVGFDFGTTNSLISVIVGDRAIDIVDTETALPFPSVVRYEGERTIVGREAKQSLDTAGVGVHGDTVLSPKFLLGKESVHVRGVERSPVDIVYDVVSHVKSEALKNPRAADLEGVTSAVVTIPLIMNGRQRAALRDAFRRADIGIMQFVHEPLAALYGHFRSHEDTAGALREHDRRNVLVVDWGGGTLDLTLCRLSGGQVTQFLNSGSWEEGGDKFDEAIREGVIERFCNKTGIGAGSEIHPDARLRLRHDSERSKIDLSTRSSVTLYRPGFFRNPDETLQYLLTREDMEEMTRPIVQSGMDRIRALLDSAGIGAPQVALCLVTGGMAAMPAISGRLHELFGPQRVQVSERSATLVAQGAAWIAHDRQRLRLAKTIELQLARGAYLPLIDAGSEMPIEHEVKSQQFHLYCSDPRDGSAKFQFFTPEHLGADVQTSDPRTPLGNIVVRVDDDALPFRERLELDLSIDDDMILHAYARSADLKDEARMQFQDLEFSISFPDAPPTSSVGGDSPFRLRDSGQLDHPGALVIRANVTSKADDFFVPGELLYTYKRGYFDSRLHPPRVQDEERLYYEPCAVCGRPSSDPACRCASGA